jgi:hypothetical protein
MSDILDDLKGEGLGAVRHAHPALRPSTFRRGSGFLITLRPRALGAPQCVVSIQAHHPFRVWGHAREGKKGRSGSTAPRLRPFGCLGRGPMRSQPGATLSLEPRHTISRATPWAVTCSPFGTQRPVRRCGIREPAPLAGRRPCGQAHQRRLAVRVRGRVRVDHDCGPVRLGGGAVLPPARRGRRAGGAPHFHTVFFRSFARAVPSGDTRGLCGDARPRTSNNTGRCKVVPGSGRGQVSTSPNAPARRRDRAAKFRAFGSSQIGIRSEPQAHDGCVIRLRSM